MKQGGMNPRRRRARLPAIAGWSSRYTYQCVQSLIATRASLVYSGRGGIQACRQLKVGLIAFTRRIARQFGSAGRRAGEAINMPSSAPRFVNPLPGVPDVESPFFDRLFAQKGLSEDRMRIAHDLREKGYAVLDFPDAAIHDRICRIRASLESEFDLPAWRESGWKRGEGLRIQDVWRTHPDVAAIAANKTILDLLEQLYGRPAFPFQTLNFPVGTQQAFHSDSVHFSSVPERFMCGVWVAFEDVDDANGPLEYFPGSHRLPLYVNEHINACSAGQRSPTGHYGDFVRLWRELVDAHGFEREVFHARKGQALIWSANLLHGGSRQIDPARTRWSQVTHYYFEGCTYYTPLLSDPAFGSIHYRELVDIRTGDRRPNIYSGRAVPDDVIRRGLSGPMESQLPMEGGDVPSGFDPAAYLLANPDVAASGADPVKHWKRHGKKEGRRLRP